VFQQLERMQALIRGRSSASWQARLRPRDERAQALAATIGKLAQALASPKRRGQ
jgi:hypothetical protein